MNIYRLLFVSALLLPVLSYAADSPPNGAFWRYRVTQKNWPSLSDDYPGDFEIRFKDGALKVFYENKEITGVGPNDLKRMLCVGQDEWQYLPKDCKVIEGRNWEAKFEYKPVGLKRAQRRTITYTVQKVQTLTTPAGTFNVREIKADIRATGAFDTWDGTLRHFVAEECHNCIVKFYYANSFEQFKEIELIGFGNKD